MATRFELHLVGMDAPEGLIDADRLIEIVRGLQDMATRLGRLETDAAPSGRPSHDLDRVAALRIGLEKGSTTIIAERDTSADALAFDMEDEERVDRRFAELIQSVGADERPEWVSTSLAEATERLVIALRRTAPTVEVRVDGVTRKTFATATIHRETWRPPTAEPLSHEVTFTGQLYAVNLHTHRFQVQDDVGHQIALPRVANDVEVGRLVGQYVSVSGTPECDSKGRLTQISAASIRPADPISEGGSRASIPLAEILSRAPGPVSGGIPGLSAQEIEAFLEAMS